MAEEQQGQPKKEEEKKTHYLKGMAIGGIVGLAGYFFGNTIMGIEIGMLIGMLIGAKIEKRD